MKTFVYEVPEITTYTEAELLAQLGPAYTDTPDEGGGTDSAGVSV